MFGDQHVVGEIQVPSDLGAVADLAPVRDSDRPVWLALGEDDTITRWDMAAGSHEAVGATTAWDESHREPWTDSFGVRRHLHASHDGMFAAVVNDHGRYGQVVDLRTGAITLELDNDGEEEETVPFSLQFTRSRGRCVVIHRTACNRLDVSDPQTGALLTDRPSPEYLDAKSAPPEHYLDYFHGALYVSPDGKRILDDGWAWHPIGIPVVWDLDRWIEGNVWESEDGPSRVSVCDRGDYWNHAMTWIDSTRIAVGVLGHDERDMRPGARIFDISRTGQSEPPQAPVVLELLSFEGPAGHFFSDGTRLFSSGDTELAIWDPTEGKPLGTVPDFSPTHYHPGARQFVQVTDDVVRFWTA
ncbi:hypothetical protein ACIQAC_00160 [Streptomyces sp. NPDC088387]|uniref:hypothetical protein n=1 Tax=Streptomyces sp. NPDC088387 TaxID=3365859 RepID=UPI00380D9E11